MCWQNYKLFIVQHDVSPADVQVWHGYRRKTFGEVYQMRLIWNALCVE